MNQFDAAALRLLVAFIDYERAGGRSVDDAVRDALTHCAMLEGGLFNTLREVQAPADESSASMLLVRAGEQREYLPLIIVGHTCDVFSRVEDRSLSVGVAAEVFLKRP